MPSGLMAEVEGGLPQVSPQAVLMPPAARRRRQMDVSGCAEDLLGKGPWEVEIESI
jgi:hypothetical protein